MIVSLCIATYVFMILATFYILVRREWLEDQYDRFNQIIVSLAWPIAGPIVVIVIIFKAIASVAIKRRNKSKLR